MPPSHAAAIEYAAMPRSASTGGRREKDAVAEAAAPSPRRPRSAAAGLPMVAGAGAAVGAGAGVEGVRELQAEREGLSSGGGDFERKPSTPHV